MGKPWTGADSLPDASSSPYQCPTCRKGFKRRQAGPFCVVLGRKLTDFSDILKRHREECMASRPKRQCTNRNRACYRCATAKRRCDSELPCRNCTKNGLSCTYPPVNSHDSWSGEKGADQQDQLAVTRHISACLLLPAFELDSEPARFFPFLLEFTKDISLLHSFENSVAVANKTVAAWSPLGNLNAVTLGHELFLGPHDWSWGTEEAFGLPIFSPAPLLYDAALEQGSCDSISISQTDNEGWQSKVLATKTLEIALGLGGLETIFQAGSALPLNQATSVASNCLEFFSPSRLQRHLDLYWEMWYPNWPTIHKPLFDPQNASSLLVAAMAVIGACHSPDPEERTASDAWALAVESWASTELDKVHLAKTERDRRNSLQTIQAAFIICIHQNWNGPNQSKRRMRRQFFAAIVGVSFCNFATDETPVDNRSRPVVT